MSLRRLIRANAKSAVAVGQRLPCVACFAAVVLLLLSLSLILLPASYAPSNMAANHLHKVCKICGGRPLLGIRSFVLLVLTMSSVMLALKHHIIPQIIDPQQFEEGFDLGKYYGFAAQIFYHFVLCTCFTATIWFSLDDTLYHLATLAEPAYCTIDVLVLLLTGSVYGKLLQLTFHFSSAICLGIANALQTPSLKLSVLQKLWMQVLSLIFWAVTRVGLVFILGVCVLMDVKRIRPPAYKQVMLELNAAALGSFAFVVIKTPIITRALREALQEYQQRGLGTDCDQADPKSKLIRARGAQVVQCREEV